MEAGDPAVVRVALVEIDVDDAGAEAHVDALAASQRWIGRAIELYWLYLVRRTPANVCICGNSWMKRSM